MIFGDENSLRFAPFVTTVKQFAPPLDYLII